MAEGSWQGTSFLNPATPFAYPHFRVTLSESDAYEDGVINKKFAAHFVFLSGNAEVMLGLAWNWTQLSVARGAARQMIRRF
jgi:hypothetical protein